MKKIVLLLNIWLLLICSSVFGEDRSAIWKQKYGEDYIDAPLAIQKQYHLATEQNWYDITAEERFGFLTQLLQEQERRAKAKEEEKNNKIKEKEALQKKKDAAVQARQARIQAQAAKLQARRAAMEAARAKTAAMVEQRRAKMQALRDKASRRNQR